MLYHTTGTSNVAVGMSALESNTTASYNTALGYSSLSSNTTGHSNAAVGYGASNGNTTGVRNTSIGESAGDTLTTGTDSVFLGRVSRPNGATNSNTIVIGANATGKGSNTGFISPNNGSIYQGNNSSSWATTSDQRLKKNITDSTKGLTEINQLQVRNFEYRTADEITELAATDAVNRSGVQVGVIAQEIQAIFPDCVKEESTGVLAVDPDSLTWHMIKAVQELSTQNAALAARLTTLEEG
jgi:hypothetical protein